ncbi:MAG: hypothetical protein OXH70_17615 [Acidobacteria bacterium]|nr:hypothetical protein [Acidobacteriota bacterium]
MSERPAPGSFEDHLNRLMAEEPSDEQLRLDISKSECALLVEAREIIPKESEILVKARDYRKNIWYREKMVAERVQRAVQLAREEEHAAIRAEVQKLAPSRQTGNEDEDIPF